MKTKSNSQTKVVQQCVKILGLMLFSLTILAESRFSNNLSNEAAAVEAAYQQLQLKPNDSATQQAYLKAFPQDMASFNRIFNPDNHQQLFDGLDYVFQLENIANAQAQQTLDLLIKLASELTWKPNAPDYLQLVLMKVALNNPQLFAEKLLALTNKPRDQLLVFLNSGRNGGATGYTQLVQILKRLNQNEAADRLIAGSKML